MTTTPYICHVPSLPDHGTFIAYHQDTAGCWISETYPDVPWSERHYGSHPMRGEYYCASERDSTGRIGHPLVWCVLEYGERGESWYERFSLLYCATCKCLVTPAPDEENGRWKEYPAGWPVAAGPKPVEEE